MTGELRKKTRDAGRLFEQEAPCGTPSAARCAPRLLRRTEPLVQPKARRPKARAAIPPFKMPVPKLTDAAHLAALHANPPANLSTSQAAAYLNISPRLLMREVARPGSSLRPFRIGRRVLYRRADLDRFTELQVALAA